MSAPSSISWYLKSVIAALKARISETTGTTSEEEIDDTKIYRFRAIEALKDPRISEMIPGKGEEQIANAIAYIKNLHAQKEVEALFSKYTPAPLSLSSSISSP